MANTAYSHDFRDRVIQCYLNRGTRSARDIASEFGISHSTLFDWISGLKVNESGETLAVLAEDWPPSKKLQTISLFDSLPESERGEFLRKQGLTSVHVQKWRSTLLAALDKRDREKARLEQRVRQLERELDKRTRPSPKQQHCSFFKKKLKTSSTRAIDQRAHEVGCSCVFP